MSEDEQRPINGSRADELVKRLRESFNSGKTRSYAWRAFQLKGIIRMIDEKEGEIMNALHADLSKPRLESFVHEISLAKSTCSLALKELQQWMKPEKVSSMLTVFPSSAEIVPEPLGVVLIISAWNYPFFCNDSQYGAKGNAKANLKINGVFLSLCREGAASTMAKLKNYAPLRITEWRHFVFTVLAIDPVIGAIAAGNAVVLKPSEIAPSTSALFARLLPKYVDNSCIKVVEGTVPETTALLEQKWDKILYTGNAKVGRIIMAAAAKHLTPVVLELGGKCPVVVDSNVDLKVASKRIVVGKWGSNNGQACIAPDYIITTKSFAPQLVDALKISLKSFYGENPMQSEDLSRVVNSNHFARIIRLLDDEKISGKIIHGGEREDKLLKIAPTLLLDVPDDSLIMQEEIFGPLLPIVTVDNIEESIDLINSKPKPLSAYLFTKNKKLEEKFVRAVSAGGLLINDTIMHFANPNLPFGGVGESGIGAYHGKFSFDAFSHRKAVLHRSFGGEVSARYPPYTPQKQRFLRALLSGDIIGVILAIIGFPRS